MAAALSSTAASASASTAALAVVSVESAGSIRPCRVELLCERGTGYCKRGLQARPRLLYCRSSVLLSASSSSSPVSPDTVFGGATTVGRAAAALSATLSLLGPAISSGEPFVRHERARVLLLHGARRAEPTRACRCPTFRGTARASRRRRRPRCRVSRRLRMRTPPSRRRRRPRVAVAGSSRR